MTLERRARWLQGSARSILKVLDIKTHVEGQPPMCGLVVSNHLSYLDIIIISVAMPCFFVSKIEVGGWPFFGRAARSGGTIFLDRSSLASAMTVAEQMTERLKLPIPVLLFPEGTSTDGAQVLRFHSRLIDPATAEAAARGGYGGGFAGGGFPGGALRHQFHQAVHAGRKRVGGRLRDPASATRAEPGRRFRFGVL